MKLGTLVGAYLLGAVPWGVVLFRMAGRGDLRATGSGNIGATNALRSGGSALGIATLALDVGKGAAAVALTRALLHDPFWESLAAFGAVLGHCFPIFLGFRGGKGIATGCGAYGVLAPIPMALSMGVFAAAAGVTRMVSVGSLCAGAALPLFAWWLTPQTAIIVSAAAAAALTFARHRANIARILSGTERTLGRRGAAQPDTPDGAPRHDDRRRAAP
ncbi:MAG TPA: glycerol-3-phosphate 1-O-acyltransferase PlsY [Candidatus Polarisedimenticolia bacterium]|nr:glycerol-3-phosphate 1-O-acyltransferase PlsY [Candidatus Polarisedimenticolia bacterium]